MGIDSTAGPLLLWIILVLILTDTISARKLLPSWAHCTSNLHCAPGYCCRMGYERYSVPSCDPILKVGESCKPGEPFVTNGTRGFPNGQTIELEDVYVMFCPCAIGLVCDRDDFVCRDASDMKDFNHLGSHFGKGDD